uniref:Uncharacterized protein n=1 Tax=Janibacter limosus TaxID=53458 RepID=A0AC61U1U8_9MICO|nr:hypothetical protein [Janibacter limosus]
MAPFDETLLDDEGRRRAVDRADLLRAFAGAGARVREAITLAAESELARVAGGERPRAVHVAAVGGAESVSTVLDLLISRSGPVLLTCDGSGPPAGVGRPARPRRGDLLVRSRRGSRPPGERGGSSRCARPDDRGR